MRLILANWPLSRLVMTFQAKRIAVDCLGFNECLTFPVELPRYRPGPTEKKAAV